MRKVIVNNIVSIDGRYAASDGNPLVLQMDAAFDRENLASLERAEVVLLGRDSFDGFSAYWPFVADAPAPDDPSAPEARALDEVNRAISRRYNAVRKAVVTDRGPISTENPWFATTTVLARNEVVAWISQERDHGTGDIVVFGSHILWNSLLAAGMVDELHLMVSPNPLGDGVPLFTGAAELELRDVRTFENSSNVQLRYAAARR
jgi:dihydrofolate reductase